MVNIKEFSWQTQVVIETIQNDMKLYETAGILTTNHNIPDGVRRLKDYLFETIPDGVLSPIHEGLLRYAIWTINEFQLAEWMQYEFEKQ